ncbi:CaiB/BaiF CoA transferase family protein [Bacillus sp. Marseille-P3661]|uniref:CaiB/BaiF CoA transferase family protein n=1 Tax=Bacillus sp. Marseille-P3661 TaxID=1936234 RepID=UPI000C83DFE3|nr:CoA transferase [Bacillus sp. Marseille-P3661]
MNETALDGVVVLDLTQFEAGTVCTQTLAWLGATVIKLEPPVTGEQGRWVSRDKEDEDAYGFLLLNSNKKSVTVNLKTDEGKELVKKMAEKADVFVENYGPGVIERLGLDYETLKNINPQIIYAQIKGFGKDGPYANLPAFDPIAQAVGASMSLTGEPDGLPMRPGFAASDSGAGYHCTIGILAALRQRDKTGIGQRIEIAMQDVMINFCRSAWGRQLVTGKATTRGGNGNRLGLTAPSNLYPCKPFGKNDYVYVYVSRVPSSSQWERLLKALDRLDLLSDSRYKTPESRYEHRHELDKLISEWTSQYTKYEAMEILGAHGVPAGAILDTKDITNDLYLRERGTMVEINHPVRGKVVMPGNSIRLSESNVPIKPAPLLGEHNKEIYEEMLALTSEELEYLRESGVI